MNAPTLPALTETGDGSPLVTVMPEEPVLPLAVEAYHALLKSGVLESSSSVEFLDGFLVPKMVKGPRHERTRRLLRRLLEKMISPEYFVDEQAAFTTTTSEPEPDVVVVRGSIDDFFDRHPTPEELALVVEIADTSLRRDRGWKKRVYARAGLASYWVVNLASDCVEAFSKPSGNSKKAGYAETAVYQRGDSVPVIIAGQAVGQIAVAELLGKPAC